MLKSNLTRHNTKHSMISRVLINNGDGIINDELLLDNKPSITPNFITQIQIDNISSSAFVSYYSPFSSFDEQTNINQSSFEINPQNTKLVLQGDFAITTAESQFTVLASHSANPCVILAAYNDDNHWAALSHIDPCINFEEIHKILQSLKPIGKKFEDIKIQLYLASGDIMTTHLEKIKFILNSCFGKNLEIKDIFKSSSLAINSKSGEVSLGFSSEQLLKDPDFKDKMEQRAILVNAFHISTDDKDRLPLNQAYDGRKELILSKYKITTFEAINNTTEKPNLNKPKSPRL